MISIREIFRRRKVKEQASEAGTFIMEANWERSEELHVDRLGPSADDIVDPERVRTERWRPKRTLG